MSQPYTPTTEKVRGRYATAVYEFSVGGAVPDPEPEFDRWYQAEIAAAEQRGAIKALRDAVKEDRMYNGISFFVPEEALLDRADQKENQ